MANCSGSLCITTYGRPPSCCENSTVSSAAQSDTMLPSSSTSADGMSTEPSLYSSGSLAGSAGGAVTTRLQRSSKRDMSFVVATAMLVLHPPWRSFIFTCSRTR